MRTATMRDAFSALVSLPAQGQHNYNGAAMMLFNARSTGFNPIKSNFLLEVEK